MFTNPLGSFSQTWSKGWILNKIQRKLVRPSFIPQLEEFPIALSMKISPLSSNAGSRRVKSVARLSETHKSEHISLSLDLTKTIGADFFYHLEVIFSKY